MQREVRRNLGLGTVLVILLTIIWVAVAGATTCNIYDSKGGLLDTYTMGGSGLTVSPDGSIVSISTTYNSGGGGGTTSYTVTPSAGAGGTISPSKAVTVSSGGTTSFTVTPNSGYSTASVSGCWGTWTG